jgi:hypothetical protein
LDREGREAFDRLFAAAKFHLPAMVYASRTTPLEPIMMGILLEQQKTLTRLQEVTCALEAEVRPPSGPPA